MGSFPNDLIAVFRLITALMTCLLQMARWAREGKWLAPNHRVHQQQGQK